MLKSLSKEDIVLFCQKHISINVMAVVISSLTDKSETLRTDAKRKRLEKDGTPSNGKSTRGYNATTSKSKFYVKETRQIQLQGDFAL